MPAPDADKRDINHGAKRLIRATLTLLVLVAPLTQATASPNLPLDHWAYAALDELDSTGLIPDHLAATRPITYDELSRIVSQARASERILKILAGSPPIPLHTQRTLDFLEEEVGTTEFAGSDAYLYVLRTPRIDYSHLTENSATSKHSLVYNNEGIEFDEGSNLLLNFAMEAGLGPFSAHLSPLVTLTGNARFSFHQAYLKVGGLGLELEAGRGSLWWGPGNHGSLIMTNNANPLDFVRLTKPLATPLPWALQHLGPFRFDLFLSRLESNRVVPRPYLASLRINMRPHRMLELGLSRTTMMFGAGQPGVKPNAIWQAITSNAFNETEDISSSITNWDTRLIFPAIQVYSEIGLGNSRPSSPFAERVSYLAGAYFPIVSHPFDLRLEYADLTGDMWYRDDIFGSGYTYNGRVLGHHAGDDSRDVFLALGLATTPPILARVSIDIEERGKSTQPTPERHYQAAMDIETNIWDPALRWSLQTKLAYERIDNLDHVDGTNHRYLVQAGILRQF